MYDCYATRLPALFKRCFRMGEAEELELFKREGDRRFSELTKEGKSAWRETARFLAKFGGPGPWAQAGTNNVN